MDMFKLFRGIIIFQILILLLFFVSPFATPYEVDGNGQLLQLVGLVVMIVYVYDLYLLYYFKPLGKTLFIPITCFILGLTFALPIELTYQHNHFFYIAETLSSMVSGAIITFIYFSDLKSKFDG